MHQATEEFSFDFEVFAWLTELGVLYAKAGRRSFPAWAEAVISEIGDGAIPYLKAAYNALSEIPGLEEIAVEFDLQTTVRSFDVSKILAELDKDEEEYDDLDENRKVFFGQDSKEAGST